MGMVLKKRQLLTATLVIALGAAVAVNWYYNNSNLQSNEEVPYTNESVSGNLGDSILVAGTVEHKDDTEVTTENTANNSESDAYFSQAKLKRSEANDRISDEIEDILENETLADRDISKLETLFDDYQGIIKAQSDAENLIIAKTGCECLVIINEDSCQVIMEKNSLNDTIILQITEIIEKNTNISAENLSIIEIK